MVNNFKKNGNNYSILNYYSSELVCNFEEIGQHKIFFSDSLKPHNNDLIQLSKDLLESLLKALIKKELVRPKGKPLMTWFLFLP